MKSLRPAVGFFLILSAGLALACGHCVEDKVAATYDYGVEQQAGRDGLRIAYLGIAGRRAETAASAAAVGEAMRGIPGVSVGTLRVSVSPAAASFAWSEREATLATIVAAINRRLAADRLRLELLRVWDVNTGLH